MAIPKTPAVGELTVTVTVAVAVVVVVVVVVAWRLAASHALSRAAHVLSGSAGFRLVVAASS